jgi:short-subunit dehydrogenase
MLSFLATDDRIMRYLIIGATSAIASSCARAWLDASAAPDADQADFFLVGRTKEKLEQTASDLIGRGAHSAAIYELDVVNTAAHAPMLEAAVQALGAIDVVLIAHGTLPDQGLCEDDPVLALEELATNGTSVIALLILIANRMERQRRGTIAVVTSVAADRGRPSNYLYGSAKAAVSTFCEGLRGRLFQSGVHLIDIRPGFVDTPMTAGLDLPKMLVATPDVVAKRIVTAIAKKRDVVYVPAFWWLILLVIRSIPRPIFKRLSL